MPVDGQGTGALAPLTPVQSEVRTYTGAGPQMAYVVSTQKKAVYIATGGPKKTVITPLTTMADAHGTVTQDVAEG